MQNDLLALELFDKLLSFGSQHGADDFVSRIAHRHAHAAFQRGMQQTFIIFRHGVLGQKFRIVGEADVGLACNTPEIQTSFALFLGVLRIGSKIRRVIRAQQESFAHEHQIAFGGLHGVGDVAFGLGLFHHAHADIRAGDPIGFHNDARVL